MKGPVDYRPPNCPSVPSRMSEQDIPSPLDQALEWCVRLHDTSATEADRQAFERWLAADCSHPPAWQRACQVWGGTTLIARAYANANPTAQRRRAATAWVGWASAAALLLGVTLVALGPERWADYRTTVAQTRSWQLDDGSTLQLAPQTSLDVKYSAGERRIRLYRGEAWFKVAANPERPFIVEAGDSSVRALGTAFDVRFDGDQGQVVVTEHAVRLTHNGKQADVEEGQALSFGHAGLSTSQAINVSQQLSWREQRLVFKDTPLPQVIEQLQRYSEAHLLMSDKVLQTLSVTAAFDARNPVQALDSLQVILPLRITTVGPWLTLIRVDEKKVEKK